MEPEKLKQIVEAALLAAGGPLSLDAIQGLFLEEEMPEKKQLREVCEDNGLEDVQVVGLHDLILKAMDKIEQDDEWYALGQIGQFIVADTPDFDTRTYGKRKLSDLVQELKRFETKKIGNQLMIRRID